ncbi:MAG: ImmA/IrrE family metallo-endopeptidase [Clostridiales bacterium]|jgi:Zn-dependent peptidase ImmA (M78 family)|nr:ImmA/IrrE family metallo-endopeptidase [Clostridiales bacterium]
MSIRYVCEKAEHVIKKYDETDPFRLAAAMKCLVLLEPMGKSESSCKGLFLNIKRVNTIILNSDLPAQLRKIILAHELGHIVLHKSVVKLRQFHEFSLYNTTSNFEYEANLFAAEILLDDDEVIRLLGEDSFFFSVARQLEVPPEMLDFKFRILKSKGKLDVAAPISSRGDYLRRLDNGRE